MDRFRISQYIYRDIDNTNRNLFLKDNRENNINNHLSAIQNIAWNKYVDLNCEGRLGIMKTKDIGVAF